MSHLIKWFNLILQYTQYSKCSMRVKDIGRINFNLQSQFIEMLCKISEKSNSEHQIK